MYEAIHLVSVLGIIGKSEYVSYDFDQQGLRVEITRYLFDPQAVPTDLNDIIEEGIAIFEAALADAIAAELQMAAE